MLKLEQINIVNKDSIIVEVLEPVVYTHVGTVAKTDETIQRAKDNAPHLLAKVIRLPRIASESSPKLNDIVMINRNSLAPITFPVEGYDSPKIAIISTFSIEAIIEEDSL